MNLSNYQELVSKVGLSKLDEPNKETYNIVKEGSANFTDPSLWNEMLADADIKEAYELHIKNLQRLTEGEPVPAKKETPKQKSKRKAKNKETMQVIKLYKADEPKSVKESKPKPVKKAKPKSKPAKKTVAAKTAGKKVAKAPKKKQEAKFPVTVKRLSKELQLIKRMAGMDGKRKTVNAISSFQRDLSKVLKSNPDRKPVLNDIHKRIKTALQKAQEAGVNELDIKLETEFKKRLLDNAKNAKPKMKVEYLAGITGKK